jgi:hypothetical protein
MAPRGLLNVSTVMDDDVVDGLVERVGSAIIEVCSGKNGRIGAQ